MCRPAQPLPEVLTEGPPSVSLLVKFPSGAVMPSVAFLQETVGQLRARVLAGAGVPVREHEKFGVALGFEGLPEDRAVGSFDLQQGDTVSLFLRSPEPVAVAREQAMLWD